MTRGHSQSWNQTQTASWGYKRLCLGMSVYILSPSLSLLLLFNKWVETSCDVLQEYKELHEFQQWKEKGDSLNSAHRWSTHIHHKQTKKNYVSKNLKTKYTALLHIGALINCSLKASSQILFYSFNSNCRAMCSLQEKENRRKEKGGGEDMKSFPQGASTSIFRQDPAKVLRFFMEKGWKSIKLWEHFMASTPYKGHLWVDDQASLWLPSYHAHLITYWKNSIHHLPSVRTMLLAAPVSQSEQTARNSSDNDIPFCPHRNWT